MCGLVRRRGLEPLCLAALAPQASASANFAASALCLDAGWARVAVSNPKGSIPSRAGWLWLAAGGLAAEATYTFAMINRDCSLNFGWVRWVVVALLFAAGSLRAQSYSLGPGSQPLDGVSKGTVSRHGLAAGVFY